VQTVQGQGFRFEAPAEWGVSRLGSAVSASSGPVDLVQARHFTLVKTYRPALFAETARELDRTAEQLARQNGGRVTSRGTRQIAGRKSRYYEIAFGKGKMEEIAFVLDGKDEYYLLCRRASSAADDDCTRLFSSFALNT
jgi:hypothetical protein